MRIKTRKTKSGPFAASVIKKAAAALIEYCEEDCIPKRDYAPTLRRLKKQDFLNFTGNDWWLLYDAIGTRPEQFFDDGVSVLYDYASCSHWLPIVEGAKNRLAAAAREAMP